MDGINQTIAQIHQLYQQNRKIFRHEAYKVHSTDVNIGNLDQLFDVMLNSSKKRAQTRSHTLWRINRMTPARLLRALFPSPKTIPLHAGIDIERYIAFDVNGGVTYQLPSTDCSNMFVYQAIGSRVIHLQPTSECRQQCRRITVQLKQNHTCKYPLNPLCYSILNTFLVVSAVSFIFHILTLSFVFQYFMTGGIGNRFLYLLIGF